MLQYKDYLERVIAYCDAKEENSFNEIAELFPKVCEIDWDNYYPDSDDVIDYIFESLINSIHSDAYVESYYEYDKSVVLSGVCSLEELEDLEKVLNNNEWTIDNFKDIKEDLEEENRKYETREGLIQEIRNKATVDQLQKFVNELC